MVKEREKKIFRNFSANFLPETLSSHKVLIRWIAGPSRGGSRGKSKNCLGEQNGLLRKTKR